PPRSPASRGPLPPEGALFILGRPGDEKKGARRRLAESSNVCQPLSLDGRACRGSSCCAWPSRVPGCASGPSSA
ncbi:MAG: hypothetical protein EOO29_07155, partial [Comamonadaceae bacterium]